MISAVYLYLVKAWCFVHDWHHSDLNEICCPLQKDEKLSAMIYFVSQLRYQLLPIAHFPHSSEAAWPLKVHVRRKDLFGILRQSLVHEPSDATRVPPISGL